MMRVFAVDSKEHIAKKIEELCTELASIKTRDEYETLHRSFCDWFVKGIRTAEKKHKNGKIKNEQAASFGHAAKILDIATKVYVYYCGLPTSESVKILIPLLHGAVDTPMLEYLKAKVTSSSISARTIAQVGKKEYEVLQELIAKDINDSFGGSIFPVQYDDIMWHRLNRNRT